MNTIFALVGPAHCGKSMLMKEVVRLIPERVGIIKSFTTRAQRDADDAIFYDFLVKEALEQKRANDELVEYVEHAGNYYGYDRQAVESILARTHGICAVVESAVYDLINAGYTVAPIKIIPAHAEKMREVFYEKHKERINADKERGKVHLNFAAEIINSFEPGGKEKAINDLVALITNCQQKTRTV